MRSLDLFFVIVRCQDKLICLENPLLAIYLVVIMYRFKWKKAAFLKSLFKASGFSLYKNSMKHSKLRNRLNLKMILIRILVKDRNNKSFSTVKNASNG